MKEKSIHLTRTINILCAVLMLALLILQFVPFWNLDGESVSIGGYVWFCIDHSNFTSYFQEVLNNTEFNAGNIALFNTVTMAACVVGLIMCLKNSDNHWPSIIPAVYGILGIVGYIAYPVFKLGTQWGLHIGLCIGMLILAAVSLALWVKEKIAR